ncbi:hypothetical protein N7517_003916 [Penicillium concentricum]|uniref:Uncharacterized protein n=1 Tax=Penicillium concentricum TaxID=293559 RepID=A0A9W9S5U8_9EURO|nr:uncharacterized protein N7517_003916 [Penicillium concentricum]KAJ5371910.1 hypothetical protein N7517_003916 [Penicillium concentricum]
MMVFKSSITNPPNYKSLVRTRVSAIDMDICVAIFLEGSYSGVHMIRLGYARNAFVNSDCTTEYGSMS